jgi:Protein of unknown function (DUF3245)
LLFELNLAMTMSQDISDGAIIFNRASLALAKSQRLIASWLPPKAPEEAITTKTEEELDREESEAFLPVPELYDDPKVTCALQNF